MPERVAGARLTGPLRCLVGGSRVVPVGAIPVLQALLIGKAGEVGAPRGPHLRVPRYRCPFGGDPRVQLERAPLDLEVVFVAELVDPSLADVAVGSDEVADHRERRRHEVLLRPCEGWLRGSPPDQPPQLAFFPHHEKHNGIEMA